MQVPDNPEGRGHGLRNEMVDTAERAEIPHQGLTRRPAVRRASSDRVGQLRRIFKNASISQRPRKPKTQPRWSGGDDARLLNVAGEKNVRELGKMLRRTENAISHRLASHKVSVRVTDGYTMREVAENLHVDRGKLRRWLLDGKMESNNLQVSMDSIKKLCERGETEIISNGKVFAVLGRLPERVLETMRRSVRLSRQKQQASDKGRYIIQSYTFARVGRILQVNQEVVKQLVGAGLLKLCRPRIEEDAIHKFVTEYPSEINWELVGTDFLEWLGLCRSDGETEGEKSSGLLNHLHKVRTCPGCHRLCRGNAYWTHIKFCRDTRDLEPEVLEWAAGNPKFADRKKPARLENMAGRIQVGRYSSSSEGSAT